jgi:hypothetical protein
VRHVVQGEAVEVRDPNIASKSPRIGFKARMGL